MGLRINLSHLNWLAYVLEPTGDVPPVPVSPLHDETYINASSTERDILRTFLESLRENYYSSPRRQEQFHQSLGNLLHYIDEAPSYVVLDSVRDFFRNRPWTALVIPSFRSRNSDELLTSRYLMERLTGPSPDHPGLLLQLQEVDYQNEPTACFNLFPALRAAVTEMPNWPGVLVWSSAHNSMFLPLGSTYEEDIAERSAWIFNRLYRTIGRGFSEIKREYFRKFGAVAKSMDDCCHLVQMSDIHIGSPEASRRLSRLKHLLSDTIEEHGARNVIPVVSGDVINTPSTKYSNEAREFTDFIKSVSHHPPFFVLGNHDVAQGGFGRRDFSLAKYIHPDEIREYSDKGLTLVGFDSCESNFFGAGGVGEEQLFRLGNQLDERKSSGNSVLIGIVHHHPLPVGWPEWQKVGFLERWLHRWHEPTVAFQNAKQFMHFVKSRNFAAVLHGHKHIPRITTCPDTGLPVFGCGSSVGKIATSDGTIRLSLNIVSFNRRLRNLTCRMLMETIPGAGLKPERDEIFSIQPLNP